MGELPLPFFLPHLSDLLGLVSLWLGVGWALIVGGHFVSGSHFVNGGHFV